MGIANGGALVPGYKADLIIVDLNSAHLVPVMRVLSAYVHQGQARDVEAVMVDGRWLMRNGTVLTMDEERILAEAQLVGRLAWRRLFDSRPDLEVPRDAERARLADTGGTPPALRQYRGLRLRAALFPRR